MPITLLKSLKPRPFRSKEFTDAVKKQLRLEGKEMKTLYLKTVRTWRKKARFRVDSRVRGEQAEVTVSTKNEIYKYLDYGTKIRWALMSRNFQAKTRVREVDSYNGAGGAVVVGRSAMQRRGLEARPGIKARKFSVEIRKLRKTEFYKNMRKVMSKAAGRVYR